MEMQKIWNCRSVSVIPLVVRAGNTWDHYIAPESLFIGNSYDPMKDPTHLRL